MKWKEIPQWENKQSLHLWAKVRQPTLKVAPRPPQKDAGTAPSHLGTLPIYHV